MSCYNPIRGFRTPNGVVFSELRRHDILGSIDIACGQCIGCRMRRASDWTLRVMHEASCWESNCFVTLTYGPNKLPPNASLDHRDFQLFLKRLRKKRAPDVVRFFMCGEYGDLNARPHYHACLFNVDFRGDRQLHSKSASGFDVFSSAELQALWPHGIAVVQDLVRETAGYTARYIMKKALGQNAKTAYSSVDSDGVVVQRRPEYACMSLRPGVGATWFDRFAGDVFPVDHVVADGVKHPVPEYYKTLAERRGSFDLDAIEFKREMRARERAADNTEKRLAVREVVHKAKLRNLKREL